MSMLGAWWGYAEGDRTLVGAAVVLIVAAAIGFVLKRLLERRRLAARQRADASLRMSAQSGRWKRSSQASQSGRFRRR